MKNIIVSLSLFMLAAYANATTIITPSFLNLVGKTKEGNIVTVSFDKDGQISQDGKRLEIESISDARSRDAGLIIFIKGNKSLVVSSTQNIDQKISYRLALYDTNDVVQLYPNVTLVVESNK